MQKVQQCQKYSIGTSIYGNFYERREISCSSPAINAVCRASGVWRPQRYQAFRIRAVVLGGQSHPAEKVDSQVRKVRRARRPES
jgi:hypothetical protein